MEHRPAPTADNHLEPRMRLPMAQAVHPIEIVDGDPTPAVDGDTDGQLHAETGIIADANDTTSNTGTSGISRSSRVPG